jgi:Fe-S-cluster-containing hydrogenase component 2
VGDACPQGALKNYKKEGGRMSLGCSHKLQNKTQQVGDACPQGALKNYKKEGGRMSLGCSQKLQ